MAGVIPVDNETMNSAMRTSKSGRQLEYHLRVLQQPQRARACGAGAKSSADRRPVDPPPVVELTVLENSRDITLGYNANFFLFATLEAARTVAQPRGQPITPPVLTGVPVAGVAYLDRPKPAGYFIFPDLSVRHEGNYRLSFNLFEETKDPDDADIEPSLSPRPANAPIQHMNFRLAVKSSPFQVYSAKKFPGLSESTQLSRVVAEQGCRVRIRRDVRMRRRTEGKDDGYYEEEDVPYDRGRLPTPDTYAQPPVADRARSGSRGSIDPSHPFGLGSRRTSMTDMSQYHQPGYQTPHIQTPVSAPMTSFPPQGQRQSHLSFGSLSNSDFGQMPMPMSMPPLPVAQPAMPQPTYNHQPSPHSRHSSNPQSYHPSPQTPVHPSPYRSQTPTTVAKVEYRPEASQLPPLPPIQPHVSTPQPDHPNGPYALPPNHTPSAYPVSLPPLHANHDMHVPNSHIPPGYAEQPPRPYANSAPEPAKPSKRPYDRVFHPELESRLQNGMRPSGSHHEHSPYFDHDDGAYDDEGNEVDEHGMVYKRANGTLCSKSLPPQESQDQ